MIDAVFAGGATASQSRSLLPGIPQRSPSAFHLAIDEVSAREGVDCAALEQLRISLSIVGYRFRNVDPRRLIPVPFRSRARWRLEKGGGDGEDAGSMVVASTSSDPNARTVGVSRLVEIISREEDLSESERVGQKMQCWKLPNSFCFAGLCPGYPPRCHRCTL